MSAVLADCPQCKKPTPANEIHAYGRCENCFAATAKTFGGSPVLIHHMSETRVMRKGTKSSAD